MGKEQGKKIISVRWCQWSFPIACPKEMGPKIAQCCYLSLPENAVKGIYWCISVTSGLQGRNNVNMSDGRGTESKFLKQIKYIIKSSIFNRIKSKSISVHFERKITTFILILTFVPLAEKINKQLLESTFYYVVLDLRVDHAFQRNPLSILRSWELTLEKYGNRKCQSRIRSGLFCAIVGAKCGHLFAFDFFRTSFLRICIINSVLRLRRNTL